MRTFLLRITCLALPLACSSGSKPEDSGPAASSGEGASSSTDELTGGAASTMTGAVTTGEVTTDEVTTGGGTTGAPTSAGASSGTEGASTGETGGPLMSEDEVLLRQAIVGEADAEEAVQTISERGGFPIAAASGGFLFACLCGQGAWTLAGDHNAWMPEPMTQAGSLWWIEVDVADPEGSLYKFHEPGTMQWIADPHGRRYGFDGFGRYTLVRASAAHLERWFAVGSADLGLQPRDLQVFVPDAGVFTHALYVHDGQNLFDPEAPWGGWHLQDSLPGGVLVVGIDNTPERVSEYTQVVDVLDGQMLGGKGEKYAHFVEEVIRPRMEAAYGPAEVVGTMGSSLGGLISLVIADLFPMRYDMAISLSGTLGWGSIGADNETILGRYMKAGKRDFAIYLDSGGEGVCVDTDMDGVEDDDPNSSDNFCENAQMNALLQKLAYKPDVELFYVYEAGAPHNEAAWAGRVTVPLEVFAGL